MSGIFYALIFLKAMADAGDVLVSLSQNLVRKNTIALYEYVITTY